MADDFDALLQACTRFVHWHGNRAPSELLAEIPGDVATDRYGEGGIVAELESEVAGILGKPSAVFVPSGTMAQQATLRVHADRSGRRTIVFHPACHIDRHEEGGYQRLHGLLGRPAGNEHRLITIDDLRTISDPPAALVLELPQRDIGGQLPEWSALKEQVAWAREHGAAAHMDGARMWECTPHYGRRLDEIAALFDTVYVSFYKGLGALSGCCVAGPEDIVAELREWRTRHGGTLFAMWPYAASALASLRARLPRMPAYYEHARAIADALRGLPGVDVVPDPPQVPMMHLLLRTNPEAFVAAARKIAEEDGIWTWRRTQPTASPGVQLVELVVGDATMLFQPSEVRDVVARLTAG